MNLIVAQFPKHITAHLNGITMGGGLGLTVNADRRIVDSSTLMAMPETKIGFFPDADVKSIELTIFFTIFALINSELWQIKKTFSRK